MDHSEYLEARRELDRLNKAIDDAPGHAKPVFQGIVERLKKSYWQGYIDAIRMADTMLQCKGDDRTIRHCRQAVLKLACVSYDPDHAVPMPVWPTDERAIELLSGPSGVPASVDPYRHKSTPSAVRSSQCQRRKDDEQ